jgi:hypothetical protein
MLDQVSVEGPQSGISVGRNCLWSKEKVGGLRWQSQEAGTRVPSQGQAVGQAQLKPHATKMPGH